MNNCIETSGSLFVWSLMPKLFSRDLVSLVTKIFLLRALYSNNTYGMKHTKKQGRSHLHSSIKLVVRCSNWGTVTAYMR